MFDFVKHHETVAVLVLVVLTIAVVIHYERWQDRRALNKPPLTFIWQCVQFYGGANVYTPQPMTRAQAVDWCSKLGAVAYVDESHHKIFFRARGGA